MLHLQGKGGLLKTKVRCGPLAVLHKNSINTADCISGAPCTGVPRYTEGNLLCSVGYWCLPTKLRSVLAGKSP